MANNFKNIIDRQMWVPVAPTPNAHAAGISLSCDLRNDASSNPYIAQLVSNTVINKYNKVQKAWGYVGSVGLAGTFGAGAGTVYAPSRGLFGVVAAGCSTTSIVISTAFPASVGVNGLANKGDSVGFRIRITGNVSGSSGKIEERTIISNSGGTTPTILLDAALTFTPANGDAYEILAGKYFCLGASTLASGSWKSFESATNYVATLGYTNLPATISTDFAGIALDELYVPYDRKPGEGFIIGSGTYDTSGITKNCLTATNSASGTLTGQSSGGDYGIVANEYRNFQIRIVEDTGIPTAVGQRRIIASHTGGASTTPVYTLGTAWSVTPSATAKYVIENPNLILIQSSASAYIYTYNYSGATINNGTNSINSDAWSSTYFAAPANAHGAGVMLFPSHGIEPDSAKNSRHSYIYRFRGGNVATIDLFDIAGGTTGAWTAGIVVDGAVAVNTGSCGKYAPFCCEGRYGYFNAYVASQINQVYRFDVKNRVIMPVVSTDWIQSGTAAVGDRIASECAIDGSDKYSVILLISHGAANAFELVVQA